MTIRAAFTTALARSALDAAREHGWTEESTACDYATAFLVDGGMDADEAGRAVREAWEAGG